MKLFTFGRATMEEIESASSPMEEMIQRQIVDRGVSDERVLDAIRSVPRQRFFPRETADKAFSDNAAPIGHGQTISQPFIVALMTDRLEVESEHRILELGTGSGYQTAILARLAREVYSIERVKPLLDEAFERLMDLGIRNAHFRFGDGTAGWPEAAPFDRIIITASAPELPSKLLLNNLVDGGIAVVPVGAADQQILMTVRRHGEKLESEEVCPVRFVKLIGDEGWKCE